MSDPIAKLDDLAKRLRGPDGCPWDQKQTPESVRRYLVEEAYEAAEAIADGDDERTLEELGDLLFQLVFTANLYQEMGRFSLADAAEAAAEKMIRRHPHVFGRLECETAEEVLDNWGRIKRAEKGGAEASTLGEVPRGLPALMRADRLSSRAARVGFDWPDAGAVWDKVGEELAELGRAVAAGDEQAAAEELGDLLFSLANLARHWGRDPEALLQAANSKFERRFKAMEAEIKARGGDLEKMSLAEMDAVWEELKGRGG